MRLLNALTLVCVLGLALAGCNSIPPGSPGPFGLPSIAIPNPVSWLAGNDQSGPDLQKGALRFEEVIAKIQTDKANLAAAVQRLQPQIQGAAKIATGFASVTRDLIARGVLNGASANVGKALAVGDRIAADPVISAIATGAAPATADVVGQLIKDAALIATLTGGKVAPLAALAAL